MHDTVHLERKGLPTVVIAHDTFEKAARFQAQGMGLPSARIVTTPVPHPGESVQALRARMDKVFAEIVDHLTGAQA